MEPKRLYPWLTWSREHWHAIVDLGRAPKSFYDAWSAKPNNFDYFTKLGKMTQGVRRLGSAAIDLCYIAAGRLDGYWEFSIKAWDIAAAGLIAEEAGAKVTNIQGEPGYINAPQSVVAANPLLHEKLLAALH